MKKLMLMLIPLFSCTHDGFAETLNVCGHQSYAPFMWMEDNKIVGVGTDITKMIFNELGITINNNYIGPWKRCLANVELGETDLLVAAYKTKAREKYAVYSKVPLSKDANAIFVWKGKEFKFETISDLNGKTVGRVIGGSLGEKIDNYFDEHLKTERVKASHHNYMKLCEGRIDFFASGLYTAPIQLAKFGFSGKIVPLETPLNTEYLYIAISKQSKYTKFLPQVEAALQKLTDNGTVEKIINKHLNDYIAKHITTNQKMSTDCGFKVKP